MVDVVNSNSSSLNVLYSTVLYLLYWSLWLCAALLLTAVSVELCEWSWIGSWFIMKITCLFSLLQAGQTANQGEACVWLSDRYKEGLKIVNCSKVSMLRPENEGKYWSQPGPSRQALGGKLGLSHRIRRSWRKEGSRGGEKRVKHTWERRD